MRIGIPNSGGKDKDTEGLRHPKIVEFNQLSWKYITEYYQIKLDSVFFCLS